MSEVWYYREGPGSLERGPVSHSDLQFLRSIGTVGPGMQVRTAYGDWEAVSGPVDAAGKGAEVHDLLPAATGPTRSSASGDSHTSPSRAQAPASSTEVGSPNGPPPIPDHPLRLSRRNSRLGLRWWLIPIGVAGLLLVLLLLLQSPHSRPDSADVGSTSGQPSVGAEAGKTREDRTISVPAPSSQQKPADITPSTDPETGQSQTGGTIVDQDGKLAQHQVVSDGEDSVVKPTKRKQYFISSGAQFFGLRATGQRFVFLIDSSQSMDGGGAASAKRELIASIRRMNADMEVEVIFFTDRLTSLFGGYRSVADVERVVEEVKNAKPYAGGTPVMPAIRKALLLRPDAIFLLTDGAFDEGDVTAAVSAVNPAQIPINTVGFQNRSTERKLRSLATSTGGNYKYVAN